MNKYEFFVELRASLSSAGCDAIHIEKAIDYYKEMIADRIEDGATEAEAVASLGTVESIVAEHIAEIESPKKTRKAKKNSFGVAFSKSAICFITTAEVILGIVFYSLIFSFAITTLAVGLAGIGGLALAFIQLVATGFSAFMFVMGASFVSIGLTIPFAYITRVTFRSTKATYRFFRRLKWSLA